MNASEIKNSLEYIHENTIKTTLNIRGQIFIRTGNIEIYSVSLLRTNLIQGYRARTTYEVPDERNLSGQLIKPSHTKTIEVVLNGPGISKAKEKLTRAINMEMKGIESRKRFTMPPAKKQGRSNLRRAY